jgi:hypothetical protein
MKPDKPAARLLERLTAIVLLAVVAALGWMILAAYWPGQFRLPSAQMEIVIILGLLLAALLLVSVVALLHTRT